MSRALQSLRSCTASLSSRTLSRPPIDVLTRRHRLLAASTRRHFSDDKGSSEEVKGDVKEGTMETEKVELEVMSKLKAKEAEVVDLTGRLRYLQADFLNLQRNSAREKEQTRDFAITRFASDLLDTVDVLTLALKSVPKSALPPPESPPDSPPPSSDPPPPSTTPSPTTKSAEEYLAELYTGVEMTQRLLQQTLFKYQVKPFDPTGDKFDPNRHEALYQAPAQGEEPGTVIDCLKIGYTIKDRILRAAQVGVAQEAQP